MLIEVDACAIGATATANWSAYKNFQQARSYGNWSRGPQDIGMPIEVNSHATSATTIPSELLGHTMSCQLEIHLA